MKGFVVFLIVAALVLQTTGCSAPTKVIGGVEYKDYGLLNEDDKNPNVQYEPNWWNIVMGAIFFEMIIPPIYVFGFHLFEPVGLKTSVPGQVGEPIIKPTQK